MQPERFARDARAAMVLAEAEVRELGDNAIGPEHVLVGVLQSAGRDLAALCSAVGLTVEAVRARLDGGRDAFTFDDDAAALASIGIDLKACAKRIRTVGGDAFDDALRRSGRRRRRRGQIPLDRPGRKVLEYAHRELARRGRTIECEHLLLGILDGGDRYAIGLIGEHVDTEHLRNAVTALLDQAA
jgi:ATP-dependent Clp protease ATP-binding subunit ClpA